MVLSRLYVRRRGNGYRRAGADARARGPGGGAKICCAARYLWLWYTTAARDGSCRQDPATKTTPCGSPQSTGRGGTGGRRQAFPGQAGRGRAAAGETGLGLPARADRGDRDCPLHSGYPWPRRLRRRGSGAARGHRAAGQAQGGGQAGGDPSLHHGVCDRRLGAQGHGTAGHQPRLGHRRSRQFR